MSERSKETVLKTVEAQVSASSNLALSAAGFRAVRSEPFIHTDVTMVSTVLVAYRLLRSCIPWDVGYMKRRYCLGLAVASRG